MKRKYTVWYYISNYKFNSLFLKNFLIILVAVYLPLALMCMGIYFYFQNAFLAEVTASAQNSLTRIKEIVDTVQTNITISGANLAAEGAVEQFVMNDKWELPSYETARNIYNVIKTITLSGGEYVESIYVYSERNEYILSGNSSSSVKTFNDTQWIDSYEKNKSSLSKWSWGRAVKSISGEITPCITTAYTVPLNQNKSTQGVVLINMSGAWLTQLVNSNNEDYQNFFIVAADGKILYNQNADILGLSFEEETGYALSGNDSQITTVNQQGKKAAYNFNCIGSDKTQWYYASIGELTGYQSMVTTLKNIILLLLGSLLLLAVAVSYLISIRVFLPIKNIIQMIDNPKAFYDRNTLTKKEDKDNFNELKYITTSFLSSIIKTEKAQEELVNYFTKLKEAQVALLQTQINPHFLYNTLQTINFMAISLTKSDNGVSQAIGMLSTMFSQMMQVDSNTISIAEEIEYSKAYVDIELLRHKDEFEITWDIEEKAKEYMTVKLTLQPILENSIKHGFAKLKAKGVLNIRIKLADDTIVFSISDNGIGQQAEWIERINNELQDSTPLIGEHIGMRNVNQRIKLIFGNEYGVFLKKTDDGGMCVKIVIPKTEKQQ